MVATHSQEKLGAKIMQVDSIYQGLELAIFTFLSRRLTFLSQKILAL
jgi:hypothetical protein